jgi:coenzyme Q-binding protein COQ10
MSEKASRTEVFNLSAEELFNTIIDYESYPKFITGVSKIEVISKNDTSALVKYHVDMMKKFEYIINLSMNRPTKVSWKFVEGDLFKENNGGWDLKDLGNGKTEVTYTVQAKFKMLVPSMVVNKLVGSSLPAMMKEMHDEAIKRKGK